MTFLSWIFLILFIIVSGIAIWLYISRNIIRKKFSQLESQNQDVVNDYIERINSLNKSLTQARNQVKSLQSLKDKLSSRLSNIPNTGKANRIGRTGGRKVTKSSKAKTNYVRKK